LGTKKGGRERHRGNGTGNLNDFQKNPTNKRVKTRGPIRNPNRGSVARTDQQQNPKKKREDESKRERGRFYSSQKQFFQWDFGAAASRTIKSGITNL